MASPRPVDPALDEMERQRLVQYLLDGVGALLWEALQAHPPPWPAPDPAEDPEVPALWRKARRTRRRQAQQTGGARAGESRPPGGRDDAGAA